jgi:hypothetical protein
MVDQPANSQTTNEEAFKSALIELLTALPCLPDDWQRGSVTNAFRRALAVYERERLNV